MGECNLWLRSLGSLTSSPENMFQWNGCAFRKTMAVRVPGRVLSKIFLFFVFRNWRAAYSLLRHSICSCTVFTRSRCLSLSFPYLPSKKRPLSSQALKASSRIGQNR